MRKTGVTTIIVNWNLKEDTTRCLESVEQLVYPCHTVVVDNGSQDGSTETLKERFPRAEIIPLATNHGFGRACNIAIKRTLALREDEFIFLLNNDAVVHPMALSRLVDTALTNPKVGLLSPKIYYRHAPQQIWYAGARRRRGVLAATDTGRDQIDREQLEVLSEVDYVFGAAMLIRRSVLEKVGLFDERFFLYLEDLDLCLRAQKAGFSLFFVPQAHVWHTGSASTAHNLALRRYHQIRSTVLFLKKHISPAWIVPAVVFWTGVLAKMVLTDLIHGDLKVVVSYWKALTQGATGGNAATLLSSSSHSD